MFVVVVLRCFLFLPGSGCFGGDLLAWCGGSGGGGGFRFFWGLFFDLILMCTGEMESNHPCAALCCFIQVEIEGKDMVLMILGRCEIVNGFSFLV